MYYILSITYIKGIHVYKNSDETRKLKLRLRIYLSQFLFAVRLVPSRF